MGERRTPDAPDLGRRRPPRAPSCRPRSAQSQLARLRAVGLVTGPHARIHPGPQPVGSGPRQPAQRGGSRGWESAPDPGRPTPRQEAPPPGHPHAAPTARKSARCGVGDGSQRPPPPRTHSQWVVGPGSPPRGRAVGGGRAPDPGRPTPRQEAPPQGTLMPPPQRAKPARKSARSGVGAGSPRPQPPRTHSQWVVGPGSPPRGRAVGGGRGPDPGRPTPRQESPPPGTLMPPPQHARECAVGLVTVPHARTPPHPQPLGSGPLHPAQRAGSRGWESARPRTPHTRQEAPPSGAVVPPPQRAKAARKSARCGVGDGSPRPHPPAPTASG